MKKETREKILGLGMFGIIGAWPVFGLAVSCARDVPVYSQREVVQEAPGQFSIYKSVWSDAEQLKLSVYAGLVDGSKPLDLAWSRYEAKDSAECLREGVTMDMRIDDPEQGLAGMANITASDELCNGSVDSCRATYKPDNGNSVDISADVCMRADEEFALLKETFGTHFFNINTEINAWHERKGL